MIVERHPFPDPGLGLRSGFPSVEVDAFVFQAPPQPFNKDVVQEPAAAVLKRIFLLFSMSNQEM